MANLVRKRKVGDKIVPTATTDDATPLPKPGGGGDVSEKDTQQMALKSHADCCKYSMQAALFAVFVDSMGLAVLKPNFPSMVGLTTSDESFEGGVKPFDPATAFYVITGATQLGGFCASLVIAPLSDKFGRKPAMSACMIGGAACCILKYLAQNDFKLFVAASFINGCFGASMTVAMAYINDLFPDPADLKKKMSTMAATQGLYMLGMTFGGVLAIIMGSLSIFFPLLPMAGLNVLAWLNLRKQMIDVRKPKDEGSNDDDDVESKKADETPFDKKTMWHVIVGSFVDNLGSTGCSMALSPVLVTAFMATPEKIAGLAPPAPLSATGYQAIAVCTSFSVIFGISVATPTFKKIGTAGGCVMGNFFTALVLFLLLMTAKPALDEPLGDDHGTWLGIYTAVYFLGFPLTVISQISTGPMLSAIAPPNKRGYVQGINAAVMQIGMSLGALGIAQIGTEAGIDTMMFTCVGLSLVAALVNFPLIKHPAMAPPPKAKAAEEEGEDGDDGSRPHFVGAEETHALNMAALADGRTLPYVPYGRFVDDKPHLDDMELHAHTDFKYLQQTYAKVLGRCQNPSARKALVESFSCARTSPENQEQAKEDFGKWFADYLTSAGYWVENQPTIFKQMVMAAFPPLHDKLDSGPATEESFETMLLRMIRVMRMHVKMEEEFDFNHAQGAQAAAAAFLANRHT